MDELLDEELTQIFSKKKTATAEITERELVVIDGQMWLVTKEEAKEVKKRKAGGHQDELVHRV